MAAGGSGFLPVAASEFGARSNPVKLCAVHEARVAEEMTWRGHEVDLGVCDACSRLALAIMGVKVERDSEGRARPVFAKELEVAA